MNEKFNKNAKVEKITTMLGMAVRLIVIDPFVDLTKLSHSRGSKFVDIVFPFIIHTENHHFVGTGIRGSNPPRKPRKLVPHENWAIHSTFFVVRMVHLS